MSEEIKTDDDIQDFGTLDVIDTQLQIIATMQEMDVNIYDNQDEDKVKVMSLAMKVIMKAQKKLLEKL